MKSNLSVFGRSAVVVLALSFLSLTACSSKKVRSDADMSAANAIEQSLNMEVSYFELDSHLLTEKGKELLRKNAEVLKKHPALGVQIEGHCDSQGASEYNMALGDMRAQAAKAYLVSLGVAPERLSTVSFGEEKLAVHGDTEDAHSKNRRSVFVVTDVARSPAEEAKKEVKQELKQEIKKEAQKEVKLEGKQEISKK